MDFPRVYTHLITQNLKRIKRQSCEKNLKVSARYQAHYKIFTRVWERQCTLTGYYFVIEGFQKFNNPLVLLVWPKCS